MPQLDTADLRDGAANIHSIGPARAAGLLTIAADEIDKLRHDLTEARRIAGRHSTELGHLRKQHVPGGFRSALTENGEPAAFIGAQGRIRIRGGDPEAIASLGLAEERGCQPGACLAEPRCRNRAEMRSAHGTPAEFAAAIARAAPELLRSEAERAIVTYNTAWRAATEPSADVQRALNSELAAMGCDPASATQAEFKRALWEVMKTKAVAEELQAAEQAERFQGLDDSDRD